MKTSVKKQWLIEKLQANREAHRSIFLKAMDGYQKAAIDALLGMVAQVKANKRQRVYVHLDIPEDQTKEYDRAIGMVENSDSDSIELSTQDYANFVQDEWAWKKQFTSSTQAYLAAE